MDKVKSQRKDCSILGNILSSIIFLIFVCLFILVPKVKLKGPKEMILDVGSTYHEKGLLVSSLNANLSNKIKITNEVDTSKIGTYKVNYEIRNGIFHQTLFRYITVKDIRGPKIELKGSKETFLCPGANYEEEGYLAIDNVDKDVTSKVKVKKNKDYILYSVTDSSGNKSEVKRKLWYQDKEAPTFSISDGEVSIIALNSTFEDQYQVTDNCDGIITDKVKVTGELDPTKVGSYTLTYSIEDTSSNKQEIKRVIKVVDEKKLGTIYLTFDDGPSLQNTGEILDILKQNEVPATFFVIGNTDADLLKRIVQEGHSIGLHSWSHRYDIIYQSKDSYFADLKELHDYVESITGVDSKLLRFPGGSSNTISKKYQDGIMSELTTEVLRQGYQYYDWNIDSKDSSSAKNKDAIYQEVVNHLSHDKVNMILFHDTKKATEEALNDIILYAKKEGYTFDKITNNTYPVMQKINN